MSDNQKVSASHLDKIRKLDDFSLTMLIGEIHDYGWPVARRTLEMIPVKSPEERLAELEESWWKHYDPALGCMRFPKSNAFENIVRAVNGDEKDKS